MNTNDMRENIAEILEEWGEDKEDRGVASAHGRYVDISEPREIADRILALLPKMPALRWDENGRLLLGNLCIGCIGSFGEGSHQGYMVNTDETEWSQIVAEDEPTDKAARAAVEKAVREALGWAE